MNFKNKKQITMEEKDMNQSFKEALKKGNVNVVKDLLKEIGDINLKDRDENFTSWTCGFISGEDYSKEDRISLLQVCTDEIEGLKGNVESVLHFFIDKKDLVQNNFENVFVISQH
ncbi:hypothetical protein [Leptospira weilii]|uniref:hypothetical protein n=1 Tax=Leptospira weilii TaxID=28184 RepID=UPI0007738AF8|nr:hypothetical protein [Leptospira weilii]